MDIVSVLVVTCPRGSFGEVSFFGGLIEVMLVEDGR